MIAVIEWQVDNHKGFSYSRTLLCIINYFVLCRTALINAFQSKKDINLVFDCLRKSLLPVI